MTKKSFTFDTETIAPLITAGLKFVEELANAANRGPVTDLNDKIRDKLNGDIYETWDDVPYGVEVEAYTNGATGNDPPVYRLFKIRGRRTPFFMHIPDGKYEPASNDNFHTGPYIRYV